jgi:hypothetical protein
VRAAQSDGQCIDGGRKTDVTHPEYSDHPIPSASNTAHWGSGAIHAGYLQDSTVSCTARISVSGLVAVRASTLQMDQTATIDEAHEDVPRSICDES